MSREFWQERPKHLPHISLEKYDDFLNDLNRIYTVNIRREFENLDFDYQNICVNSIGSDGKQERFPQSKTELVFIQNKKGIITTQNIFDEYKLKTGFDYESKFELSCNKIPTIKTLDDPESIFSFNGGSDRVYPDAILNSTLIIGNVDIYYEAKKKVLEEMAVMPVISSKIKRQIKTQLKKHLRSINTGEYRNKKIFETEPPLQYYNENLELYTVGFKCAFLRAVQRKLDLITIEYIRNNDDEVIENLAKELPVKTTQRFNYFRDLGYIEDSQVLTEAYLWFLKNYHSAQETYKLFGGQSEVAVRYDLEEFLNYKKVILEFSKFD